MPAALSLKFKAASEWQTIDVAWAAGFYEGEGSVGLRHALVSQVNFWPLDRLARIFGGRVSHGARIDKRRPDVGKAIWTWSCCGPDGRNFINAIYPYLSPRRQAQIDDKFITWDKFNVMRATLSPKQKAYLDRVGSCRNVVTGRFDRASEDTKWKTNSGSGR